MRHCYECFNYTKYPRRNTSTETPVLYWEIDNCSFTLLYQAGNVFSDAINSVYVNTGGIYGHHESCIYFPFFLVWSFYCHGFLKVCC